MKTPKEKNIVKMFKYYKIFVQKTKGESNRKSLSWDGLWWTYDNFVLYIYET